MATCKRSTILAQKMFKGNLKKQVKSNIFGLRSAQGTKGYLLEAVARKCSAKNIWPNLQANACTGDFLKINM